ncbi:B- and T-lymphocyte attenuator-like isoform X1 [Centroberyx affinis]|uniref:B- and T-lymphocyte attenuator-like isoform X1 n=1 Tax=Centroberyx affinis TaxID=166261 RepID=UPI003A5C477B
MDWVKFGQIITGFVILLVDKQAQGQGLDCIPDLTVRRGTELKASRGEQLKINCPVIFCSNPPPTVTWYKIKPDYPYPYPVERTDRIQTWWRDLTENSGIAVLLFTNVSEADAGLYQCRGNFISVPDVDTVVSHRISVTVTADAAIEDPVRTTISPEGEMANQTSFLSFHVDVARLVLFTVVTLVVLVLLGMRTLKAKGKGPAAGGVSTQGEAVKLQEAAESEAADPDDSNDDCVSVALQ